MSATKSLPHELAGVEAALAFLRCIGCEVTP